MIVVDLRCTICGRFILIPGCHTCPPLWDVVRPDYEDEDYPQNTIRCDDAEDAVLEYADDKFSDWEYPTNIEIWARLHDVIDAEWQKFNIGVESVPSFSIYERM